MRGPARRGLPPGGALMGRLLLLLALAGCGGDYAFHDPDVVPPAQPPGVDPDEFGAPPDWKDCFGGLRGIYSNLPVGHPDVEPPEGAEPPDDPRGLDWWDRVAFERYDPTLDFGPHWFPVDEGLAGDPDYFAVRWLGWIRVWSNTRLEAVLGSADDAWILIDGETVVARPGVRDFAPEAVEVPVRTGQHPFEIRFAHRSGDSGFRFRVTGGDVTLCHPVYGERPSD